MNVRVTCSLIDGLTPLTWFTTALTTGVHLGAARVAGKQDLGTSLVVDLAFPSAEMGERFLQILAPMRDFPLAGADAKPAFYVEAL